MLHRPFVKVSLNTPALLIQHRAPGVRTVGGKMELTVVRLSGEETVLTVQEVWLYRGQSAGWILGSKKEMKRKVALVSAYLVLFGVLYVFGLQRDM